MKVAINGFGRIGRPTFKRILENHSNVDVVAVNDLADKDTLLFLLEHDSSYGRFDVQKHKDKISKIKFFAEKDPVNLPWRDLEIDVVLECSGVFTKFDGAKKHLDAGAKKVIISAPCDSSEVPTFLLGVNEEKYDKEKDSIVSMGSCTTNCLAPIVKILNDNFGVEKGFMTTVHSYTNDQRILDLPHKDLRRARAAGINIIPTTTGAAKTVAKAIPELEGMLDGLAMRVPTPTVSITDFVCTLKRPATKEEVNDIFIKEAQGKLKGILDVSDEPLVSMDFKGNSNSSIVDLPLTIAKDNLLKVVSWYDNEWGYACRLAEMAEYVMK
jgi:glyceraldehyde 3-phosphate dehydrogenase